MGRLSEVGWIGSRAGLIGLFVRCWHGVCIVCGGQTRFVGDRERRGEQWAECTKIRSVLFYRQPRRNSPIAISAENRARKRVIGGELYCILSSIVVERCDLGDLALVALDLAMLKYVSTSKMNKYRDYTSLLLGRKRQPWQQVESLWLRDIEGFSACYCSMSVGA